MMTIKQIGVLSAAKMLGALYACIGVLAGAIFSCVSLIGAAGAMSEFGGEGAVGLLFGVGAIIMFPIFYGIIGFIGGAIVGFIYNFLAGMIGGIEIQVE